MVNDIIHHLDVAQEHTQLSLEEALKGFEELGH
jgi:hypothetical protein